MLASAQTAPLFLRKYQQKQIKQYRRRQPIYKGMGDVICCLDESGSTAGDAAAWGKAVAMTLLEIAAENGRKFALIHFAGPGSCKTDLFCPGAYTMENKLSAAETFLDGGTPFNPLTMKAPDTSLKARERKIGGLGIFMVRKLADEVTYEYADGKNILKIRKKYG